MAGIHIHMTASKQDSIQEIQEKLSRIPAVEPVAQVENWTENGVILLLSYEKLFLRTNSYASLTVLLKEDGLTQTADIIASGGGSGLMNLSCGANRDLAQACAEVLETSGFAQDQA